MFLKQLEAVMATFNDEKHKKRKQRRRVLGDKVARQEREGDIIGGDVSNALVQKTNFLNFSARLTADD